MMSTPHCGTIQAVQYWPCTCKSSFLHDYEHYSLVTSVFKLNSRPGDTSAILAVFF